MSRSASSSVPGLSLLRGRGLRSLLPGLALSLALALLALALSNLGWMQAHGLSALTLAIVLGMVAGHTVYPRLAAVCGPGVDTARQTLLRAGIVLYGLKLTVQDIGHMGLAGVMLDVAVLGSTFALAAWVGTRWLRLDRDTALLIGAGSSVCGAAAVMATAPVLKARSEQVTAAVATVVVFGTLAMFLYPVLYHWNQQGAFIGGGEHGFGLYTGATIHEVAQVVVAARAIGPEAADAAVMAKMVRVMMLAPGLVLLSAWVARREARAEGMSARRPITIPWFAFGFIGVVLLHSVLDLPAAAVSVANEIDTVLLATAMAALGLGTQAAAIVRAGPRPLLLALMLFVWLVGGGALIQRGVMAVFGG